MKINELDVVLLKSNEEATIIEKFDNKSFLIEIYNDGIFSLRNISIDEIKQILWKRQQTKPAFYRRAFFLFPHIIGHNINGYIARKKNVYYRDVADEIKKEVLRRSGKTNKDVETETLINFPFHKQEVMIKGNCLGVTQQ